MKILFVYFGRDAGICAEYERIAACAPEGVLVKPFALKCPRLRWDDLDRYWRTAEPGLMSAYESLHEAAVGCDVLLHNNGWSLHPEFIKQLPTYNVFCFVDDPESSLKQSRFIGPTFDAVMYGNIASKTQYDSWDCRRIAFMPIFIDPASVPPSDQAESILTAPRDVDIVLCCGMTRWRKRRLAGLIDAFPDARVFGRGWGAGWISEEEKFDLYRRAKIGWNIHNSTGPINQRMFMLAGWGIMQICDNKTGLGQLYDLDREAAGFDTIPEAIELTKHYLENDEERKHIARAAFSRFHREYHPRQVWARIGRQLQTWLNETNAQKTSTKVPVTLQLPRNHVVTVPIRAVRRAAAHWLAKQHQSVETSIQRFRFEKAVADLDESICLGHVTEYRPGRRPRSAKLHAPNIQIGREADAPHIETLCWALTTLIGPASSILVTGRHAPRLAELAAVDPGRKIDIRADIVAPHAEEIPDGTDRSPPPYDLLLCTETSRDPQMFRGHLRTYGIFASRWILCLRQLETDPVAHESSTVQPIGCDALLQLLTNECATVHAYFLPDPHVPWLEPVDGPAHVSPLIVACGQS